MEWSSPSGSSNNKIDAALPMLTRRTRLAGFYLRHDSAGFSTPRRTQTKVLAKLPTADTRDLDTLCASKIVLQVMLAFRIFASATTDLWRSGLPRPTTAARLGETDTIGRVSRPSTGSCRLGRPASPGAAARHRLSPKQGWSRASNSRRPAGS